MKKIILIIALSVALFSDASTCASLVNKESKLLKNIAQLQSARQFSIMKMKANFFQLNLIEIRTECLGFGTKEQSEADKAIASYNEIEKAFVEIGYLESSSL